jgi:tyrosyl-tRNA synthetase
MRLARQIVAIYHGEKSAEAAEKAFVETFQKGKLPDDVSVYKVEPKTGIADALVAAGIVVSKNEVRRLIEEGAVTEWEGEKVTDPFMTIDHTITLKVGKRRFITLEIL